MNIRFGFIVLAFSMAQVPFCSTAAVWAGEQAWVLQEEDSRCALSKPYEEAVQSPTQPMAAKPNDPNPAEKSARTGLSDNSQTPNKTQNNGTSHDRLFWTLPNFLTVENSGHAPKLTSKAKTKVALRSSLDPVEFVYIGFVAGIGQAQDSEPGYGQGASGYFKRFGSSFADNLDENVWTGAIFPSFLHQDPRYYQLGKGRFFSRLSYAVTRQLITRSDLGRKEFNVSELAGSAISAAISNAYHPAGDRTFVNTLSVWFTQVGWDTVANVMKEFWPDIRRKSSRH